MFHLFALSYFCRCCAVGCVDGFPCDCVKAALLLWRHAWYFRPVLHGQHGHLPSYEEGKWGVDRVSNNSNNYVYCAKRSCPSVVRRNKLCCPSVVSMQGFSYASGKCLRRYCLSCCVFSAHMLHICMVFALIFWSWYDLNSVIV